MKRIRIVGPAHAPGTWDTELGLWVKSYTDTPCGRGYVEFTDSPSEALSFATAGEALTFWKTQSKTVPLRPDGKPNRPMTAYTIVIE